MNIPFWLKILFAFLPFLWLFTGILGTPLKTHTVTFLALLVTTLLAFVGWQADPALVGISYLEGLVMAVVPIIWVILAAVFTYELSVKTKSINKLQNFLSRLSPEPAIQAVIIAFGFGGFLESVAGFGTAVAIPTAMLVGMGFSPLRAVLLSLVANSVPVAFGALGIPVIVLSRITELSLASLTQAIAWQLFIFSLLIPIVLVLISEWKKLPPLSVWIQAFFFGVIFTFIQTAVAIFVGPELVAVLASLGVLFVAFLIRFKAVKNDLVDISSSLAPYGFLLLFVLLTRLFPLPFLKAFPFVLRWSFQEHTIAIEWLTTPGTLLFLATLIGSLFQKASWGDITDALKQTVTKLRTSMLTIINIVIMAKIMGNTPMISDLSFALAKATGPLFPFFSPLLGALGTFVTGSDTSSNILFGRLQRDTALGLSLDPVWITAANTSGATAGKMISPQSIAVASAAVGLHGSEGKILSRSLWFCIGYVFLLGVLVATKSWLIIGH
ncbi:L-lactate permease [Thermospira aquatica]|uniref:L-lactate permease n=1 Tax=Thermospira aquatica TaxID=2828656 RepID=A0AAX3BCI7_9SPIR|nr:L-lactate permease [Thermospira aquatica]URA09957.1 L-lactate permease [Thermospira aquatica]